MAQDKPPEAITLQPANQPNPARPANTFSGEIQQVAPMVSGQAAMPGQQPIVVSSGKPSPALMLGGFLTMIGSFGFAFFGFFDNIGNIDEEMFCCFLCNGNAIGLCMIAVYSFQYGAWESRSGKQGSAAMSYIVDAKFLWDIFFLKIRFVVSGMADGRL